MVYLLQQVDDFAIASKDEATAKAIFDCLTSLLQLPSEDKVPFKYLGLLDDYNGVNVIQSQNHIELTCEKYICRVLISHGWETGSPNEQQIAINSLTTDHPISPLPTDVIDNIYNDDGPAEGTPAHAVLAKKYGFKYRTLLGEIMFCYTTCRPDIGYAITTTLSKFSTHPNDVHYRMLKQVTKYLRKTITWGIRWKRSTTNKSLPSKTYEYAVYPSDLPTFPVDITQSQLIGFVHAAHANDL